MRRNSTKVRFQGCFQRASRLQNTRVGVNETSAPRASADSGLMLFEIRLKQNKDGMRSSAPHRRHFLPKLRGSFGGSPTAYFWPSHHSRTFWNILNLSGPATTTQCGRFITEKQNPTHRGPRTQLGGSSSFAGNYPLFDGFRGKPNGKPSFFGGALKLDTSMLVGVTRRTFWTSCPSVDPS